MPHYLVAIYLPDGYDGSLEDETMVAAPAAAIRPVSSSGIIAASPS
jgi:hypothetical protein